MVQELKKRFIKYMADHYSRMAASEIDLLLEKSIQRVVKNSNFSETVLSEVVREMTEEGYSKPEILAHVNIIDIEQRT